MQNRYFNFNKISVYRNEILGFAIISIIFFHFFDDWYIAWHDGLVGNDGMLMKVLTTIELGAIGSMGVEIFLMLSGAGLYYSFSKDKSLSRFFGKRFSRILIPYIPVALIFWSIKDFVLMDAPFVEFVKDVAFVTFFTDGTRTIWYAGFILIMYVLFPVIYKAIYNRDDEPRKYAFGVLMCAYAVPVAIYFISGDFYQKTEIALTRIPSFVIGVLAGYYIKQEKKVHVGALVVFCIVSAIGAFASLILEMPSYLSRYLDSIYIFAALIVLAALFDLFRNKVHLRKFFRCFGEYTFELYIIHVTLRNLMKSVDIPTYMASKYMLMIAVSFAFSVLLKKFADVVRQRYQVIKMHG